MARERLESKYKNGLTLWPLGVSAIVVVIAALVVTSTLYVVFVKLLGDTNSDKLEVLKASLAATGGIGVAIAGVYAYRKQRLAEWQSGITQLTHNTDRFRSAAEQLGHATPAVRLAGVYAMGRLADDWPDHRQQCVDVLCAYLRMREEDAPSGEVQVRTSIQRVLRDHLVDGAVPSWSHLNIDLRDAELLDANFSGCRFMGRALFNGTKFIGQHATFSRSTFSGESANFADASFDSHLTKFNDAHFVGNMATFSGARMNNARFSGATFRNDTTDFRKTEFVGAVTSFQDAILDSRQSRLDSAVFRSEILEFHRASLMGGYVSMQRANLGSRKSEFSDAIFSSDKTDFTGCTFGGTDVVFRRARFQSRQTKFVRAQFSASSLNFTQAAFEGRRVSFQEASFSCDRFLMQGAQLTAAAATNLRQAAARYSFSPSGLGPVIQDPTSEAATSEAATSEASG